VERFITDSFSTFQTFPERFGSYRQTTMIQGGSAICLFCEVPRSARDDRATMNDKLLYGLRCHPEQSEGSQSLYAWPPKAGTPSHDSTIQRGGA
jgi:hypothetical protein